MITIKDYFEINGEQLRIELLEAGIEINPVTPYINAEKELVIHVVKGDELKVGQIVNNHKPKVKSPLTIEEKLSRAGITIDELKCALGL